MKWDFQNLFRRHASGIARSLRRRGFSEDIADDLTQDTFVRVLASPPGIAKSNHNPNAYLYKVSRNLGINYQKRQAFLRTVEIDADDAIDVADPAPSPESIVYSRQCLLQTRLALEELPERTRVAFEMHRLGERTLIEVAEELGISTTRAWALVRDGYRHLMRRVDGF